MKKLFFLLLSSMLTLALVRHDYVASEAFTMNGYSIYYYSNIYEPVDPYSTLTINGSIKIEKGINNSSLRLRYELYSPYKFNGTRSYANGYASKAFSYPEVKNIDYSFRISDIDDNAKYSIKVKFGLYDTTSKNYLNYIESYLYDKESRYINIDQINNPLNYEPCLYLSDESIIESFNFSNFSHILELDEYHALKLNSLSFEYNYYKEINYKEVYIEFNDSHNLFPYIDNINNKKRIPLYLLSNGSNISFIYKDLYVNKETLEMSLKEKEDFIKTNTFYLPKNKLNDLQGYVFTLKGVDIGASNICFDYELEIGVNRLLLGPCDKSHFCIVGGTKR